MQKDIASKTKSSLIWNTSLRFVFQIFRFGISIIIARLLEPKDFGIMGMASMVVFYSNSITNFGFSMALIQRKDVRDIHISSVFTFDLVISLFLTIGTILLSTHIADFFNTSELVHVLWVLSPIFLITTFFQMPITLMKRQVDFKTTALTDFYRGTLQSIITLVLAILGFRYWSLVIGLLMAYSMATIYIMHKSKWKPSLKYVHREMKGIFQFGMYNFFRGQLFHLTEYADKFIIGKLLGPAVLGSYEKAFVTAAMVKQDFSQKVNAVMFSSFSRMQSEKNNEIKRYFKKSLVLISLTTFPICIGLSSLGSHFVVVLLGDKWEPMIVPLKILSIAFMFSCIGGLSSSLNVSMGYYRQQTFYDGVCIVLLIVCVLLVVNYGTWAVALVTLLVYALMFALTSRLAINIIQFNWIELLNCIMPAIISSIMMAAAVFLAKEMFLTTINLMNFIVLTAIGASIYILAVIVPRYSEIEDDKKEMILQVRDKINKMLFFVKSKYDKS